MPNERDNILNSKVISATAGGRGVEAAQMRITSRALFQQAREILIDHDGQIYRLRITQQNKLILNK